MKLRLQLAPLGMSLLMLAATGCGKGTEPATPAPAGASSTSTPAPAANPAAEAPATPAGDAAKPAEPLQKPPQGPSVKSDPARDGEIAATIGDAKITRGEVVKWMNLRPGKKPLDVLDELVTLHLFGLEAKKTNFAAPEGVDANDLLALGEAFAAETFRVDTVTDAELERWFTERRAANRIVVADEALANRIVESFKAAPLQDARDGIKRFGELSREHNTEPRTIAPRRVLFDAEGLGETGQPAVHATVAKAAFEIANDGEIAGPFPLGPDKWVIVQRVALRPKMEVSQTPPNVLDRARDGIRARRGMEAMKARAAELRRDVQVSITDAVITDLVPAIRARRPFGKGGPLDTRRMRHDRIIGRETNDRLDAVMPEGAEEGLRRATPEEVRSKMGGGGGTP